MPFITISGWTKGCNTVSAIKEIRERAQMPLDDALAVVNRVLQDERVVISLPTLADAQALGAALSESGLLASTESEESATLMAGSTGS